MRNISKLTLTLVLAFALAGCAIPKGPSRETVEKYGADLSAMAESKIVRVEEGAYLGARPVPLPRNAELSTGMFARHMVLAMNGTLEELGAAIQAETGLPVLVDRSSLPGGKGGELVAPAIRSFRIGYDGPLKGLLDLLASRSGLSWSYNSENGIIFSDLEVKTFTLWAAPGAVKFSNQITNQSKDSSGSSSSSGAGVSTQDSSIQTAQTHSTTLQFDIWKDVENQLKGLLSPVGSVSANQAAGTITVKDVPSAVRKISGFIDEINGRMARQVALSVKVWSLEVSDSSDIGVNLNLFFEHGDVRVAAGTSMSWINEGGELSAAIVDGRLKDSSAMLKALRSIGNATQVTSGGGVVMSNQPVPIQAVKREAYLASSATTNNSDYGQTTTLTPGEITTGFAMTVIPHIMEGRRVILQYTVNLSSLDELVEFSSGDATVQLPKVSTRSFSQRMTLKMGQTLVLAGFEQEVDSGSKTAGFLGLGKSRQYAKSMIIITISTEAGDV